MRTLKTVVCAKTVARVVVPEDVGVFVPVTVDNAVPVTLLVPVVLPVELQEGVPV